MRKSFKILMAIFAIIIFLGVLGAIGSNDSSPHVVAKLTKDQVIAKAFNGVTYDELMRYNEKYINEIIHQKTSTVIQMQNIYGDRYFLMVNVGEKIFDFDFIYLNYNGERILEDDTVEFWGVVKGLKEYETALGSINTVPEIDVLYLNVIKKGD